MLNMNPESLNVKDLVHVENDVSEDVQELRLNQDQLDDTMMAYLRMVINLKAKPQFESELDLLAVAESKKVNFAQAEVSDDLATCAVSLDIERDTLLLYKDIIMIQLSHLEKETTLE